MADPNIPPQRIFRAERIETSHISAGDVNVSRFNVSTGDPISADSRLLQEVRDAIRLSGGDTVRNLRDLINSLSQGLGRLGTDIRAELQRNTADVISTLRTYSSTPRGTTSGTAATSGDIAGLGRTIARSLGQQTADLVTAISSSAGSAAPAPGGGPGATFATSGDITGLNRTVTRAAASIIRAIRAGGRAGAGTPAAAAAVGGGAIPPGGGGGGGGAAHGGGGPMFLGGPHSIHTFMHGNQIWDQIRSRWLSIIGGALGYGAMQHMSTNFPLASGTGTTNMVDLAEDMLIGNIRYLLDISNTVAQTLHRVRDALEADLISPILASGKSLEQLAVDQRRFTQEMFAGGTNMDRYMTRDRQILLGNQIRETLATRGVNVADINDPEVLRATRLQFDTLRRIANNTGRTVEELMKMNKSDVDNAAALGTLSAEQAGKAKAGLLTLEASGGKELAEFLMKAITSGEGETGIIQAMLSNQEKYGRFVQRMGGPQQLIGLMQAVETNNPEAIRAELERLGMFNRQANLAVGPDRSGATANWFNPASSILAELNRMSVNRGGTREESPDRGRIMEFWNDIKSFLKNSPFEALAAAMWSNTGALIGLTIAIAGRGGMSLFNRLRGGAGATAAPAVHPMAAAMSSASATTSTGAAATGAAATGAAVGTAGRMARIGSSALKALPIVGTVIGVGAILYELMDWLSSKPDTPSTPESSGFQKAMEENSVVLRALDTSIAGLNEMLGRMRTPSATYTQDAIREIRDALWNVPRVDASGNPMVGEPTAIRASINDLKTTLQAMTVAGPDVSGMSAGVQKLTDATVTYQAQSLEQLQSIAFNIDWSRKFQDRIMRAGEESRDKLDWLVRHFMGQPLVPLAAPSGPTYANPAQP